NKRDNLDQIVSLFVFFDVNKFASETFQFVQIRAKNTNANIASLCPGQGSMSAESFIDPIAPTQCAVSTTCIQV
ncbi:hypothetical protein, partial [Glutamicibacter uratoxydans]|uniref:hypothetical protein n=1 Tax=Glutamicibacter uratoxydans TaxID=43667 RepID=UPI001C3F5993